MVALGPQLLRFMVPFYYLYGSISLMTLWAIFHPRETISHVTRTAGNISAVTCLTLLQRAWLQVFANNVINHQFRRPAKAIYNIAQRRHTACLCVAGLQYGRLSAYREAGLNVEALAAVVVS